MNKNGANDNSGFYSIIVAFLLITIGLAFWGQLGTSISTLTQTKTSTNASFTFPANGTTVDLTPCGQLNTSTIVIFNATNGTVGFQNLAVPANNYTITHAPGSDGFITTRITYNGGGANFFAGFADNVTCNYEPKGYIHDSAGRGVALIIPIFLAILIMISASPNLRSKALDWLRG